MAKKTSKSVNDVAVENYDELVEAVANTISDDLLLRKLMSLNVITSDNKQLIRNEKTNILRAECLLEKFILNRVHNGEGEVLFTLLDVLGEIGKCNDVVTKICTELDRPLPPLGSPGNNGGPDDSGASFGDPRTARLIEGVVLPRVSAYWNTIAAYLEFPIPKTKEINCACRGDPRECCKTLLEDWFGSDIGVKPKTWQRLVEVLSEISDIAASTVQIKKLLHEEGVINIVVNDSHQVSSDISHHHSSSSAASNTVTTPDPLSVQFSRFVATIEALLEKCHDKLEQSKLFCSNLTISGNPNDELLFSDEQLQKINACTTFNELFIILRKHWSWKDYSILTHIISITGLEEAQDEVELFETTMASYQGMKIICERFSPETIPLDYIKLKILINKPYRDLTVEKYTELHDFVFRNLDIRRYIAWPFIQYLLGSLHLEWYVLKIAAPHMIKMAQQQEEIFTSNSVVFIQVDQYVVFDYRAKDKTQIDDPGSTSSAYSSGGYDYNFLHPPDRLVCRICQLPCRETQQSECCGSVYCKCDIDQLKASATMQPTCPICRSEEFVTYPNLSSDREIQQLMVYCPDKDNTGCNWTGRLKDVGKHYSEGRECETECDKCKTVVKHKLLHNHLDTECPCYCPYCDITAEREVISSEHKEKCHKFPITCPNNCSLDGIPRDDMDEHKKVCPLQMIQCEFHNVGCEVMFPRKDEEAHATDSVTTHLQLARRRLTILNKMLEDSNARYLESTEKFTELLSDLQERVKGFDKTLHPTVDVEVQTDVDANHIETATNTLNKIINNCAMSRMYIIVMFLALVLSLVVSIQFNLYYKTPTAAADYDLPTVQEFHQKTSIVLYELIEHSTLSWSEKLYFWSSVTTVAPVVLKFSDFSQQKNSILRNRSRTFFAFTNGYLMRLTIYPSGSPVLHAKDKSLSVYLDFMKGPHDDTLRKLGYFPITKTFSVELLDPTGHSHLQKVIVPDNCDVNSVYVTGEKDYIECGFSQFISLKGYNFEFKQQCSCNKANPTICCYLTDDDALYFRVQESKPTENQ